VKVLFLLTEVNSAVPSFHAISILSAVAKAAGHQTALFQAKSVDLTAFDAAVRKEQPHVLAATAVTQQLDYVRRYIAHCKVRFPHIYTVLGGTHAIIRPRVIAEIAGLDALATNEAERPFVDLLSQLESGQAPSDIPNFAFRHGTEVVYPHSTYTCDEAEMTALPFEDRELFPTWRNTPKGIPLESLGIRQRAAALKQANPAVQGDIERAMQRLTGPETMGTLFKALALLPPESPMPAGFASIPLEAFGSFPGQIEDVCAAFFAPRHKRTLFIAKAI